MALLELGIEALHSIAIGGHHAYDLQTVVLSRYLISRCYTYRDTCQLGHDEIRIAILVYRVSQCLDLQFVYDGNAIYRPRYTLPNHHNMCRMCWSLAVA